MDRLFMVIAALSGALSVALGAFRRACAGGATKRRVLTHVRDGRTLPVLSHLALLAVVAAIGRWPASNLPVIAAGCLLQG